MLSTKQQFLLIVGAGTTSMLLVSLINSATKTWALEDFVDPDAFADIAAQLPQDRGEFALAAWELVGAEIPYARYGSILHFGDDYVRAKRCHLPTQIAQRGKGNCVAKSQVLLSILRNRFSPSEAYMAIGQLAINGTGGHAWVTLNNGGWYVLESTMPPPEQPWISAGSVSQVYIPEAQVNDRGLVCLDEEICRLVHKADLVVNDHFHPDQVRSVLPRS